MLPMVTVSTDFVAPVPTTVIWTVVTVFFTVGANLPLKMSSSSV